VKIRVTHIGEDYGTVTVIDDDGDETEYEVPKGLADAMKEKQQRINAAINGESAVDRINRAYLEGHG
jgi:hypothetical protein